MLERVLAYYNDNYDTLANEAIELERNLVALKALAPENGGDGEVEKTAYIKDYLSRFQGTVKEYHIPDERVSAGYRPSLSIVRAGKETARTMWIVSHTDVVPEGDHKLWESDPFSLRVDGNRLIGRGVQDNHSGIVPAILFYRVLDELGLTPPVNVGLLFCADEEYGSAYGIAAIIDTYDIFGENDLVYVPDMPSDAGNVLEIAEKSLLWIKVSINGTQSHGSRPDVGANAHKAAAHFITRVEALRNETYNAANEIFDYPYSSIEPTLVEANVPNINTIPGQHVFAFDCRILPQYNIDDVFADIKKIGIDIERRFGVNISYETPQYLQALPAVSEESETFRMMHAALTSWKGLGAIALGVGGGTCAYFIRKLGVDAVVCGKGPESAHKPNEHIFLEDLLEMTKLYIHTLAAIESASVAGKA